MKKHFESTESISNPDQLNESEVFKMYQISGQKQITKRSFKRYLDSKQQDLIIKEAVSKENKEESNLDEIRKLVKKNEIPEAKKMIQEILDNGSLEQKIEVMDDIGYILSEEDALEFVRAGLKSKDKQIRRSATKFLNALPANQELVDAIYNSLEFVDNIVSYRARHSISKLSKEDQSKLLNSVLEYQGNLKGRLELSEYINSNLTIDQREKFKSRLFDLLMEAITSDDIEKRVYGIENLDIASHAQQVKLLKLALEDGNTDLIKAVMDEFQGSGWQKSIIVNKIIELSASTEPKIQLEALSLPIINFAFRDEIQVIIDNTIDSTDSEVQSKSQSIALQLGIKFSVPIVKLELIKKALNSNDLELQKFAIANIREFPHGNEAELYNLAFTLVGEQARKYLISLIVSNGAESFFDKLDPELRAELIKPPLYNKFEPDPGKFPRDKFDKTGSETTLIGGELKEKAIIRHITPESFLVWQRLFEDYDLWRANGFDYVPIESIVSYKLNRDNLVDVYCGVLDLSLHYYKLLSKNYVNDLISKRDKIIKVIESLNINHGHEHDNNFCLRFFRDEQGKVDFSREPRIYLIDFDQSVSYD